MNRVEHHNGDVSRAPLNGDCVGSIPMDSSSEIFFPMKIWDLYEPSGNLVSRPSHVFQC